MRRATTTISGSTSNGWDLFMKNLRVLLPLCALGLLLAEGCSKGGSRFCFGDGLCVEPDGGKCFMHEDGTCDPIVDGDYDAPGGSGGDGGTGGVGGGGAGGGG